MGKNIVAAGLSLIFAFSIVAFTKAILKHGGSIESDRQLLIYLEFFVVGLVASAVVGREIIEQVAALYERIVSGTHRDVPHDYRGFALLFASLTCSLLLYFGFSRIFL